MFNKKVYLVWSRYQSLIYRSVFYLLLPETKREKIGYYRSKFQTRQRIQEIREVNQPNIIQKYNFHDIALLGEGGRFKSNKPKLNVALNLSNQFNFNRTRQHDEHVSNGLGYKVKKPPSR